MSKNKEREIYLLAMAEKSARCAGGSRIFIENMPVSYPYREYAFWRLDENLDELNAWLDKINEEDER